MPSQWFRAQRSANQHKGHPRAAGHSVTRADPDRNMLGTASLGCVPMVACRA